MSVLVESCKPYSRIVKTTTEWDEQICESFNEAIYDFAKKYNCDVEQGEYAGKLTIRIPYPEEGKIYPNSYKGHLVGVRRRRIKEAPKLEIEEILIMEE